MDGGQQLTSSLLAALIALGDTVLADAADARHDGVHELKTAVQARHGRISEHPRRTHYAMMFVDALDHVMWERRERGADAADWMKIAAGLRPFVQRDIVRALEDERAVMADTQ